MAHENGQRGRGEQDGVDFFTAIVVLRAVGGFLVTRSSLESHFRKVRGCSVHDEILRFKLAAATSGLENTDSAIADIAYNCGFKSAQYLHTVFRREFGCTPREYQQGASIAIQ